MRYVPSLRHDERGMMVVFVGCGLVAFMAATTLAIDVGMFMTARSQAQNSADAGALAGAVALAFNDFADRSAGGPAVTSAIAAGQTNTVMAATPSILPADVTFPNDPSGQPTRVHVEVFRTQTRGNPIPTLIGTMFGVSSVNIGASATAEASQANGVTCVKPFMIPDKWIDVNHNGQFDLGTDTYIPIGQPRYTGYGPADKGTYLVLRAGTGNNIEPTMYFSWSMPGDDIGGDFYRDNISGCNQTVIPLSASNHYYMTQEPGNMVGPTNDGIDNLIARDPGAEWDASCGCVTGSTFGVSPRITPIPLYDPIYYATGKQNGRNADFMLANVVGFFIDRRVGNQVYGYIIPISGVLDPNAGPAPSGAFPVAIRLVQ